MCFDPSNESIPIEDRIASQRSRVTLREGTVERVREYVESLADTVVTAQSAVDEAHRTFHEAERALKNAQAELNGQVATLTFEMGDLKRVREHLENGRIQLGELIAKAEGLPIGQPTEESDAFEDALVGAGVGGQDLVF